MPNKPSLQEDIGVLSNYEHFARFINVVKSLRDECILDMHEASTDKLQQLSGRIISYDQILQMCSWENLEKRHKDFL
tara:strand:+ start:140 stop:370 length:231 start_codon:yes stop_codon:yes gene_type:complete